MTIAIPSDISQETSICTAVSAIDDDILEGDECFSVEISAVMPNELTVIEGADRVNVIIEDDEGID